ncbi:hypothetical protein [Chitinophaga varians]|uniref:hypothetical protein n=1 Tax=Chitinophaga varians TaxID=2202339 RepID=UPI00165F5C83|nr:hypothetical protein [Chitinophaga varians]MBC9912884.1 hypothetical protein [Chitinophaga varians]
MTRTYLFLLASAMLLFASCSKDEMAGPDPDPTVNPPGTNPTNKLIGTWKFAGVELKGQSVTSFTDEDGSSFKGLLDIDYISTGNKGTVTFDERTMTSKDLSYTVDSKVKSATYVNGVLVASQELPWGVTMPASASTAGYELRANDSLYSQAASVSFPGVEGPLPGQEMAAKISWKGDTLVLKSHILYAKTTMEEGVPTAVNYNLDQVTKLVRK